MSQRRCLPVQKSQLRWTGAEFGAKMYVSGARGVESDAPKPSEWVQRMREAMNFLYEYNCLHGLNSRWKPSKNLAVILSCPPPGPSGLYLPPGPSEAFG